MKASLLGPALAVGLSAGQLASAQEAAEPDFASPAALQTSAAAGDYRIGPFDKLTVNVFQSRDLSAAGVQVDGAGQLALPMLGSVPASGLTTAEMSREISRRLALCCLQAPQVTVSVDDSATRQVTVSGAVKEPGVFPLRGPTHLVQALALAKGMDGTVANEHRVAIFRTVGDHRVAAIFDVVAIQKGRASDPEIHGGDTVVVDESAAKNVWHDILTTVPLAVFGSLF